MAKGADDPNKTAAADPADWATVRRFLPYLWPEGRPELRARIVFAALFVIVAKAIVLAMPFAYAGAVDAMAADGDPAVVVALGLVIAYAAARFAVVAFDNVRNIVFESAT